MNQFWFVESIAQFLIYLSHESNSESAVECFKTQVKVKEHKIDKYPNPTFKNAIVVEKTSKFQIYLIF